MYNFLRYNKTSFAAGGCLLEDIPYGADVIMTAKKFIAPRRIDYRDMLVASSDQGNTPSCVGFSSAACCEFWHWKKEHYPKQFNGLTIYNKAKTLDGSPNADGTWPKYGVKAAIELGFIKGKGKYVNSSRDNIKFTLHEHGVFVGGFKITQDWNYVDKKTGLIRNTSNSRTIGGHAICICGYNEQGVYIQNSWSKNYGIHGFAILRWEQVDKQFMNGMVIIPE
mgnify:CR=1 FL=1